MAEKPNIPVLPWPAVATPTPDEVDQGESDQKKEYALWLESALRQSENVKKPEALDRIRVLDCTSNMIIGHWCSSLFSEKGAEVIMVEPIGGDPLRQPTPFGRQEDMFKDNHRADGYPIRLGDVRPGRRHRGRPRDHDRARIPGKSLGQRPVHRGHRGQWGHP